MAVLVTLTDLTTVGAPTDFTTYVTDKPVSTLTLLPSSTKASSTFTSSAMATVSSVVSKMSSSSSASSSYSSIASSSTASTSSTIPMATTINYPTGLRQVDDATLVLIISFSVLVAIIELAGSIFLIWKSCAGYCPGCKERERQIKRLEMGDSFPPTANACTAEPEYKHDDDAQTLWPTISYADGTNRPNPSYVPKRASRWAPSVLSVPSLRGKQPTSRSKDTITLNHLEGKRSWYANPSTYSIPFGRKGKYPGDPEFEEHYRKSLDGYLGRGSRSKEPDLESNIGDVNLNAYMESEVDSDEFRPNLNNPYATAYTTDYSNSVQHPPVFDEGSSNPYVYEGFSEGNVTPSQLEQQNGATRSDQSHVSDFDEIRLDGDRVREHRRTGGYGGFGPLTPPSHSAPEADKNPEDVKKGWFGFSK